MLSLLDIAFVLSPCEHAVDPFPAFGRHQWDKESKIKMQCEVTIVTQWEAWAMGTYVCIYTKILFGCKKSCIEK